MVPAAAPAKSMSTAYGNLITSLPVVDSVQTLSGKGARGALAQLEKVVNSIYLEIITRHFMIAICPERSLSRRN